MSFRRAIEFATVFADGAPDAVQVLVAQGDLLRGPMS